MAKRERGLAWVGLRSFRFLCPRSLSSSSLRPWWSEWSACVRFRARPCARLSTFSSPFSAAPSPPPLNNVHFSRYSLPRRGLRRLRRLLKSEDRTAVLVSRARRTRELGSQEAEYTNCPASGSTADGYATHMGATPGLLQGASGAPPDGNAACKAGASRKEGAGKQAEAGNGILTSASKSESYGTCVQALPEYYRGKPAVGRRAVPESNRTSGSCVVHTICHYATKLSPICA